MSYYSHPYTPSCYSSTSASAELKLYQAFVFSVPIFFTFILFLLFYFFYLRHRRIHSSSLRMRIHNNNNKDLSRVELGLKKELREMLPIIIYKESFSIREIQCSVCLGEYQPQDKLQQIPACCHAFHMDCIDHWLATHTTCPLCRLSLLAPAKTSNELPDIQEETSRESSVTVNNDNISDQHSSGACGETQAVEYLESRNRDAKDLQNSTPKELGNSHCVVQESDVQDTRNETEEHEHCRGVPDYAIMNGAYRTSCQI